MALHFPGGVAGITCQISQRPASAGGSSALPSLILHTKWTARLLAAAHLQAWQLLSVDMSHLLVSTALVDNPGSSLRQTSQQLDASTLMGISELQAELVCTDASHGFVTKVRRASAWASNARLSIGAAFMRAAAASIQGLLGDTPALTSRV